MNQIKRIREMEQLYDHLNHLLKEAEEARERVLSHHDCFQLLEQYYTSVQWKEDYDADRNHLLPDDLKKGVLSEDGIDHLLDRYNDLKREFDR